MPKVLVVDDDLIHCRLAAEIVTSAGFDPLIAQSGAEALRLLEADTGIAAMILDLVMPEMDGMAVLEALRRKAITIPVIVQTARSAPETVVTAMRLGASDFCVKPVAPERLIVSLRNALRAGTLEAELRAEQARRASKVDPAHLVASAPAMERPLSLARKAATSAIPVLLEGESGVGKEMLARAIHGAGDRAGKPFIAVNCAAIPPERLDAALFGQRKEAGTHAGEPGSVRQAHGGTLFLADIGALPPDTQSKLLRVLEQGEIVPPGAAAPSRVNVRLIAATSRRLLTLARDGQFREDLYYRLNVFPIFVPPLRERREDIPALVERFIARIGAAENRRITAIARDAMALLVAHDWPGNVRQLENAVFRAVILADTDTLMPHDFPQIMAARQGGDSLRDTVSALTEPDLIRLDDPRPTAADARPATGTLADRFLSPDGAITPLAELERDLIAFAIDRHEGRMSHIARALGIGRSTLYRKLKDYGLDSRAA